MNNPTQLNSTIWTGNHHPQSGKLHDQEHLCTTKLQVVIGLIIGI